MQGDTPAEVRLDDELGFVVDAAALECWKVNYGLDKTPQEIAATWGNWAPSGAVMALRVAVAEIERLRGEAAMLRATMEDAAYQLSKARIWGGMDWHYNPLHPMHYKPALDKMRGVLDAPNPQLTGRAGEAGEGPR
jgi:hypothetical protein